MDAVVAEIFVEVHQHLGVARRGERMPASLETISQLAIVVDLSVQHDQHAAVFVGDRLPSAGQIDDAQAAHPDRGVSVDIHALVVGTPMADALEHPPQNFYVNRLADVLIDSGDAAHWEVDSLLIR